MKHQNFLRVNAKIVVFCVLGIILMGCSPASSNETVRAPHRSEVVEHRTDEEIVLYAIKTYETDIEVAISLIRAALKEGFGENYTIEFDAESNLITITQWYSGLARDIAAAQDGHDELLAIWYNSTNSIAHAGTTLHSLAKTTIGEDIDLVVHVVCDINQYDIFLTVKNGVIIYDILQ